MPRGHLADHGPVAVAVFGQAAVVQALGAQGQPKASVSGGLTQDTFAVHDDSVAVKVLGKGVSVGKYLVVWDLNRDTSHNRKQAEDTQVMLRRQIRHQENWDSVRISDAVYGVETDQTSTEVFATLSHLLQSSDKLYVFTLHKPGVGIMHSQVSAWLTDELQT